MLRCADDTLYTGIATELRRRVEEHNSSSKGAKYTRSRRPVELVYYEACKSRSDASKREWHIKKRMNRAQKLLLISSAGC